MYFHVEHWTLQALVTALRQPSSTLLTVMAKFNDLRLQLSEGSMQEQAGCGAEPDRGHPGYPRYEKSLDTASESCCLNLLSYPENIIKLESMRFVKRSKHRQAW